MIHSRQNKAVREPPEARSQLSVFSKKSVVLTAGLAAEVETGADDAEVPQSFQRSSIDVLVFACLSMRFQEAGKRGGSGRVVIVTHPGQVLDILDLSK